MENIKVNMNDHGTWSKHLNVHWSICVIPFTNKYYWKNIHFYGTPKFARLQLQRSKEMVSSHCVFYFVQLTTPFCINGSNSNLEKPHSPSSSSSVVCTTLVGFGLLNCRWAFSAGRFYSQTPNLEENQGFRAFHLSSQEAPSVWSDASEPSSGRWNYGREMAEKFRRKWRLPRHFWVLLHAVKHDMGQMALLPLRRKVWWGFFRPKNPTASAGFEPANLGTKGQHATSRPPKPIEKPHWPD
jgi:hypothetical protein